MSHQGRLRRDLSDELSALKRQSALPDPADGLHRLRDMRLRLPGERLRMEDLDGD